MDHRARPLNRIAFDATVHCLTGCTMRSLVNRWMAERGRGHALIPASGH